MSCSSDKIRNPETRRCVKRDGKLGREIIARMKAENILPEEMMYSIFNQMEVHEAIKTMSAFWYNADEIKAELEKRPGVFFWRDETVESKGVDGKPIRIADIPIDVKTLVVDCKNIPENAFYNNKLIESVIGPSVETIGEGAFSECGNIKTVDMPQVKTIGKEGFYECRKLNAVIVPQVKTIGEISFSECDNLTTVDMPQVKTIGDSAFIMCEKLTTVTMPNVKTIGDSAFKYCEKLTTVTMPNVKTIGRNAFQGTQIIS